MRRRRTLQGVALAAAVALSATACLSEDGGGGDGGSGGTASGDKQVEIVFGFGGEQSKGFQQAMAGFQQQSGIKIKFTEASQSFDTLIRTRVQANNLPDIALFPQPGILKDFVAQGKITDLGTQLNVEQLKNELVPGVLEAAEVEGKYYGVPISYNVKSLVFYPKKDFAAKNLKEPTTLAELTSLTNQIKTGGVVPWCFGIESAAATGWPATDWIEQMVLDTAGPETYDKWVNHEIPFTDPAVKTAATQFEQLVLSEGNVFGGRKAVASTAFSTAANPMFGSAPNWNGPAKCMLHRQGNFVTQKGFFPDKISGAIDENVGVFQFPGQSADNKPVLGGGDLAAVFNGKDDDTKQVMAFMTGASFPGWSEAGGFLSPRKDYDDSKYTSEIYRKISGIGKNATVFRFDGSDSMPGTVGSGSFWKDMVAWISGSQDIDTALKNIEDSWPS